MRKDQPSMGKCGSCDKPLYAGPLGPEHARFSDDRDHSPQLVAQRPMSLTKARAVAKDPESFTTQELDDALTVFVDDDRLTAVQVTALQARIDPVLRARIAAKAGA